MVDILLFSGMVKALTPTAEDASATADADVVMVKNRQKLVKKRQYIFSSTKATSNSFGWSIRRSSVSALLASKKLSFVFLFAYLRILLWFGLSNTNSQQITTITALSIELSSPASSHCRRNSKSFLVNRHYYSLASNSLLARTADRTPKTFALQGDPSPSKHPPSSKRSPYIVYPVGRDVTWNDLAHSWRIFSPNRDIEKISAPLRSHISSPNLSPSSGVQTGLLSVISYLPL
ncbi:hypothetical protein AVEN_181176-1 [Araneus ventricosus]|uniref:Uncharacterized protein n=1 Tax=Araneus ventricosus TaxID=182803 RepID=A0A4Y2UWK1_ARAVE|nr:hypothetical protein AVEN_181176-1 [Araneus ventricosus]